MPAPRRALWAPLIAGFALTLVASALAQSYSSPAGVRSAFVRLGASILPGGRVIAPLGDQYPIGLGAFGLAISSSGRTVVTVNSGPGRNSLTILEGNRSGHFEVRQLLARSPEMLDDFDSPDWSGAFMGAAFSSEHAVFVSEGNSGRIGLFDWGTGRHRVIDLNQNGFNDSYTGDLAFDDERGVLYAVDQANSRVAIIDVKTRRILTSVRVGRLPFAVTLSPDRQKLYVTNAGTFQYQPVPGADPRRPAATALPFPAFGFPSADAIAGADRQTATGTVHIPGLGDPAAPEGNSLCVVDISTPASPKVTGYVRTGLSPSGVVASDTRVYVSNAGSDTITVIDPKTNTVETQIPIRIPGLEQLRGVLPFGLAFHPKTGWLLVTEAGINAVAVIDTNRNQVIGHIPVAWYPSRIAIQQDQVFVANAQGYGLGPNAAGARHGSLLPSQMRSGVLSVFPLPAPDDLARHTNFVLDANGLRPRLAPPPPLPEDIRHVVLIIKEGRAYDEILGDIPSAMGAPEIARFGTRGYVDGHNKRFSLKDINITPNHHAIAHQWTFSDNFYADSLFATGGHRWLAGVDPNPWASSSIVAANSDQGKEFRLGTAPGRLLYGESDFPVSPEDVSESGTLWSHLAAHGVSFYCFGAGFEPTSSRLLTNIPIPEALYQNTSRQYPGASTTISDVDRAAQFAREMDERYVKGGAELPGLIVLRLPNDRIGKERPDDGYPYDGSYVADNDYALGKVFEYLSSTKWWKQMAVFVTESSAQGGVDHVDAQRTLLLCAGPWARHDHISHTNTSFPGLLKTIFRLLDVPPLNLFDATASDLSDCFDSAADPTTFTAIDEDHRIFDPERATAQAAARLKGDPTRAKGDPK